MAKKQSKSKPRVRKARPTKTQMLGLATMQDTTHESTPAVQRRRSVVMAEINAADNEITELISRLATVRALKNEAETKFDALTAVITRRQC